MSAATPTNGEEPHSLEWDKSNNGSQQHGDNKADQDQIKLMPAQQHYGSSMGTNANGEQNHLEGLLPPTLEATGSLVAGKDIEKL